MYRQCVHVYVRMYVRLSYNNGQLKMDMAGDKDLDDDDALMCMI